MKPFDNGNGYLIVALKKDGTRKNMYVHRIVAEAFIKKGNSGEVVNHKDYDKTNNRVDNLEWVTQKDNVRHSKSHMHKLHKTVPGKTGERYIRFRDKKYHVVFFKKTIGKFPTIDEAIKVRDAYIKENHI